MGAVDDDDVAVVVVVVGIAVVAYIMWLLDDSDYPLDQRLP